MFASPLAHVLPLIVDVIIMTISIVIIAIHAKISVVIIV